MYSHTAEPKKELTVSAQHLMHHSLVPEFREKYVLGQELGSGGFGFVVSAYERSTGIERAVKFILRKKVPKTAWMNDRTMGPVPVEVYVLKRVRHENIIQYYDCFQDEQFFYLVMELHGTQWEPSVPVHSPALSQTSHSTIEEEDEEDEMASRPRTFVRRTSCDLFECIEQHKYFDETKAKAIFYQIVNCVAYLDTLGVCHRDIKDENIVIDQDYKVKLIDFGSAVVIPPNSRKLYARFYGTVSSASPEILMNKQYRAEPAEVWSLGVLLYTLLFGEVPFLDSEAAVSGPILRPKLKVSLQCKHLIVSMLEKKPEKRLTIHQVLHHPWFDTKH
ncbi:kinase-like domain-containing protein [Sporodiniella umbellata]|nr:kinase-like domain-containing protein [Sporodiniella umbellata]